MNDTIPPQSPRRQPRTEPIFYVYLLRRNGIPFYVGKGCKKRIFHHEWNARKHGECQHQICRIIRKVWREGGDFTVVKIAEGIPEQAAFKLEQLFISIGAVYKWPLVNQTSGGEGASGLRRTVPPEEREQRRRRSIQRFADPNEHEKLSQGATRRFANPEEREKQRQRVLQRFSDPEELEKHRQRALQRYANGVEISDEERESRSQRAKRLWEDPEKRASLIQKGIERYTDPEEVERSRQISKQLWEDSTYLEKMVGRYTPQVLERMSKARSEGDPNHVGTFEGFVSPRNVIYSPVINLTAFCREHGLSYMGMWLVAKGTQIEHQGWTKYPPLPPPPPTYCGASFRSPSGEIFTQIVSVRAFCLEHNLIPSCMGLVMMGKQKSHKGWTRFDPEVQPVQDTLFEI